MLNVRPFNGNLLKTLYKIYRVRDGVAETVTLSGKVLGSAPLKGASISLNGAGILNLSVGTIVIRAVSGQVVEWDSVPNAKRIQKKLEQIASGAKKVPEPLSANKDNPISVDVAQSKTSISKHFTMSREIPTAGYFGERGVLSDILKSPVNEQYISISSFDSNNRHQFLRPCDVHLGFDTWNSNDGSHIEHVETSKDSLTTFFSIFTKGDGILFGNSKSIFYKSRSSTPKLLGQLSNLVSEFSISISKCRKNMVIGRGKRIFILSFDYSNLVGVQEFNCDSMYTDHYIPPFKNDPEEIYMFDRQDDLSEREPFKLRKFNLFNQKVSGEREIIGIQNIAVSPSGEAMCIISTTHLYFVDVNTLDNCAQPERLSEIRDEDHHRIPPLLYSPCGCFLALSYNSSGTVEIRDSNSKSVLFTFTTEGYPESVFNWSIDSKYLAVSFQSKIDNKTYLRIWEVTSKSVVFETNNISSHRDRLHSQYGQNFFWNRSDYGFSLLTKNGRIQQYMSL